MSWKHVGSQERSILFFCSSSYHLIKLTAQRSITDELTLQVADLLCPTPLSRLKVIMPCHV